MEKDKKKAVGKKKSKTARRPSILYRLFRASFYLFFMLASLVVLLAYVPHQFYFDFPLEPVSYDPQPPPSNESLRAWNVAFKKLNFEQVLLSDKTFVGPESMVQVGDSIYTGLADGRLVRVNKKTYEVNTLTRFNRREGCGKLVTTFYTPLHTHFHRD